MQCKNCGNDVVMRDSISKKTGKPYRGGKCACGTMNFDNTKPKVIVSTPIQPNTDKLELVKMAVNITLNNEKPDFWLALAGNLDKLEELMSGKPQVNFEEEI